MPKEQKFGGEEEKTDRQLGLAESLADAPKDAKLLRDLKKRVMAKELIDGDLPDAKGNKAGYVIKENGKNGKILYFEDHNLAKSEAEAAEKVREEMKTAREHDVDDVLREFDGPEN